MVCASKTQYFEQTQILEYNSGHHKAEEAEVEGSYIEHTPATGQSGDDRNETALRKLLCPLNVKNANLFRSGSAG